MRATGGPYFDELARGQVFRAPAITLTEGRAAVHQAIVGDRSPVSLDERLGRAVLGVHGAPAAVALVLDVAIGQSTVATRRVKANLFYRGVQLHRWPLIGDTLATTTEVAGLRENRRRDGRAPTGLAALRIRTVDHEGRLVLDFLRCAMLPLSAGAPETGCADDLAALAAPLDLGALARLAAGWDLEAVRAAVPGPYADSLRVGDVIAVVDGDVVSCAPELARLTLNLAAVHHDRRVTGDRLVYGGHTIGLAAHQLHRSLPAAVCVGAWHGCDHLAPVHEGATLTSRIEITARDGPLVSMRSVVQADGVEVLDWRFVAVVA